MKKHTIIFMMALAAIVFACNKDAIIGPNDSPLQQEQLLGKWNLTSATFNENFNGTAHLDSLRYAPGQMSIEFKSNGKVVTTSAYYSDTMTYRFLNNRQVLVDVDDTLTIQLVSGSALQLYFRNIRNAEGDFYEEWEHFSR